MKKFLYSALAFASAPLAVFAEGQGDAIDVTKASQSIESMKTAITTWWDAAQPVILAIIGVALVATLIFLGYKLIRKGVNKVG